LIRRGGTGSSLETPLVRTHVTSTGKRSIESSTQATCESAFQVHSHVLTRHPV